MNNEKEFDFDFGTPLYDEQLLTCIQEATLKITQAKVMSKENKATAKALFDNAKEAFELLESKGVNIKAAFYDFSNLADAYLNFLNKINTVEDDNLTSQNCEMHIHNHNQELKQEAAEPNHKPGIEEEELIIIGSSFVRPSLLRL